MSTTLRAPTCKDKPVKQPTKKRKAIEAFKPTACDSPLAAAAASSPSPPPTVKGGGEFILFLEQCKAGKLEVHTGDECSLQAIDYVLTGPPYRGDCSFQHKNAVKHAGGTWIKNSSQSQDGRKAPAGWWCAKNEDVLIRLLEIRDECNGTRTWVPTGADDSLAGRIQRLWSQFTEWKHAELTSEKALRQQRVQIRLEAERRADIPKDDEHDVAHVRTIHGIEWTDELAFELSRLPQLGPHAGISSVRRAIRAIRLHVLTAEDIKTRSWNSASVKHRKSQQSNTSQRAKPSATTHFMFGSGPGQLHVPSEAEWRSLARCAWERDMANIKWVPGQHEVHVDFPTTWCAQCQTPINLQFADCTCGDRIWSACATCNHSLCAQQMCLCRSTEEDKKAFLQQQRQIAKDVERRSVAINVDANG